MDWICAKVVGRALGEIDLMVDRIVSSVEVDAISATLTDYDT